MMRPFILFAILFFTVQPQPNQHVRAEESSVHQENTQAEPNREQKELEHGSEITIQECDNCTVIEKCVGCSAEQKTCCRQEPHSYDPRKDVLYRAYLVFTILGVIIALGGIYAIYKQTEATARSAKATERSVRLQENTQRQWVDLKEWRVIRLIPTDPLDVGFKIANPTSLPLVFHGIEGTADSKPINESAPVTLITPNDPLPYSFGFLLSPEQEKLYDRDALSIEIKLAIFFKDSHGIHWRQDITGRLLCGRGVAIYTITRHDLNESGVPGERGSREVELA